MTFPHKDYAKELYNQVKSALAPRIPAENISVSGNGVHWHCLAKHENRDCKIHCFDASGPEYYFVLNEGSKPISNGRTKSIKEVIAVTKAWLNNLSQNEIYEKFDFVDWLKRMVAKQNSVVTKNHTNNKFQAVGHAF
jgi:hypothetical protein